MACFARCGERGISPREKAFELQRWRSQGTGLTIDGVFVERYEPEFSARVRVTGSIPVGRPSKVVEGCWMPLRSIERSDQAHPELESLVVGCHSMTTRCGVVVSAAACCKWAMAG